MLSFMSRYHKTCAKNYRVYSNSNIYILVVVVKCVLTFVIWQIINTDTTISFSSSSCLLKKRPKTIVFLLNNSIF